MAGGQGASARVVLDSGEATADGGGTHTYTHTITIVYTVHVVYTIYCMYYMNKNIYTHVYIYICIHTYIHTVHIHVYTHIYTLRSGTHTTRHSAFCQGKVQRLL